jgi:hypothetical protein
MKKYLLIPITLFSFLLSASAQISLGTNDFSHAGDTIRVSTANPFPGMDLSGGANHTWDFSALINISQTIDTFLNIANTPNYLNLVFSDYSFNSNRCNQATFISTSVLNTFGIPLKGTYNMYYNSSSGFIQRGIGLSTDTIAAPIIFSSSDVVYKFPLNFGNVDSSTSGYEISNVPGLPLYYSVSKTRYNNVDGWGTLTTPYGTFPVLRVQSVIHEHDSISYNILNLGFDLPEQIEYKWLAAGKKIPLLQVNTTAGNPSPVVYRDSSRTIIGVPETPSPSFTLDVYPNPSADNITVNYSLASPADVELSILDVRGKIIVSEKSFRYAAGRQVQIINLNQSLSPGNYFLRLSANGRQEARKLVISK